MHAPALDAKFCKIFALNTNGCKETFFQFDCFFFEDDFDCVSYVVQVWHHLCIMSTDSDDKGVDWESSASDFQHHNLATLTIFGFQFADYMVSYVRCYNRDAQ
jgi:hypothetical protein